MNERPKLTVTLDSETFKNYYYLKEELVSFCKDNGLQATGSKIDITNRIVHYLNTGEKKYDNYRPKNNNRVTLITLDTVIEQNFVCSEKHRAFYKEQIGKTFSFNVAFQKWLKNNAGKKYSDSIVAYFQILEDKKNNRTTIDKQFEYNTYIRDFFDDNKNMSLKQAIKCWNYKKSLPGHNKYEPRDLEILRNKMEKKDE